LKSKRTFYYFIKFFYFYILIKFDQFVKEELSQLMNMNTKESKSELFSVFLLYFFHLFIIQIVFLFVF